MASILIWRQHIYSLISYVFNKLTLLMNFLFFLSQADGYKSTGCYNLKCQGFVMVNWDILTPGDIIDNVSVYNGPQYYITLGIKKVE